MNEELRTWYSNLSRSEYRKKRNDIIEACRISRAIFYNWLSGATPVPTYHYHTINEIAGTNLFKAKL